MKTTIGSGQKGITLVALVITVIVMLILAGVSISILTGDNGLFGKTQRASEEYEKLAQNEAELLAELSNVLGDYLAGIPEKPNLEARKTDGSWNSEKNVNSPKLVPGMTAIYWDDNGEEKELTNTSTTEEWNKWYSYVAQEGLTTNGGISKWANAVTKNNQGQITGYFVWIPRYEYKITYANPSDKSQGGTIDINFVPTSTTTAKDGCIVHPAFRNESSTGYQNGEWDDDIPGFWVAKFPAGFAGGGKGDTNNKVTPVDSGIKYTGTTASTNYYGSITSGSTKIKYPVFLPKTYAYNYINIGDMYNICREIEKATSYYGLTEVDSHMIKNSEWGAVAYLTQSKYGRNGTEVIKNDVDYSFSTLFYGGLTGYTAQSADVGHNRIDDIVLGDTIEGSIRPSYAWNTTQGVLGSSTGNVYGVYDLSGCVWERTAGYIPVQNTKYNYINLYGGTFSKNGDNNIIRNSTKYISVYAYSGDGSDRNSNYAQSPNPSRKGEAIWETSASEFGWNGDYSTFVQSNGAFIIRGGHWSDTTTAGVFAFSDTPGNPNHYHGFRSVLIGSTK